jgi:hypothetical protein
MEALGLSVSLLLFGGGGLGGSGSRLLCLSLRLFVLSDGRSVVTNRGSGCLLSLACSYLVLVLDLGKETAFGHGPLFVFRTDTHEAGCNWPGDLGDGRPSR